MTKHLFILPTAASVQIARILLASEQLDPTQVYVLYAPEVQAQVATLPLENTQVASLENYLPAFKALQQAEQFNISLYFAYVTNYYQFIANFLNGQTTNAQELSANSLTLADFTLYVPFLDQIYTQVVANHPACKHLHLFEAGAYAYQGDKTPLAPSLVLEFAEFYQDYPHATYVNTGIPPFTVCRPVDIAGLVNQRVGWHGNPVVYHRYNQTAFYWVASPIWQNHITELRTFTQEQVSEQPVLGSLLAIISRLTNSEITTTAYHRDNLPYHLWSFDAFSINALSDEHLQAYLTLNLNALTAAKIPALIIRLEQEISTTKQEIIRQALVESKLVTYELPAQVNLLADFLNLPSQALVVHGLCSPDLIAAALSQQTANCQLLQTVGFAEFQEFLASLNYDFLHLLNAIKQLLNDDLNAEDRAQLLVIASEEKFINSPFARLVYEFIRYYDEQNMRQGSKILAGRKDNKPYKLDTPFPATDQIPSELFAELGRRAYALKHAPANPLKHLVEQEVAKQAQQVNLAAKEVTNNVDGQDLAASIAPSNAAAKTAIPQQTIQVAKKAIKAQATTPQAPQENSQAKEQGAIAQSTSAIACDQEAAKNTSQEATHPTQEAAQEASSQSASSSSENANANASQDYTKANSLHLTAQQRREQAIALRQAKEKALQGTASDLAVLAQAQQMVVSSKEGKNGLDKYQREVALPEASAPTVSYELAKANIEKNNQQLKQQTYNPFFAGYRSNETLAFKMDFWQKFIFHQQALLQEFSAKQEITAYAQACVPNQSVMEFTGASLVANLPNEQTYALDLGGSLTYSLQAVKLGKQKLKHIFIITNHQSYHLLNLYVKHFNLSVEQVMIVNLLDEEDKQVCIYGNLYRQLDLTPYQERIMQLQDFNLAQHLEVGHELITRILAEVGFNHFQIYVPTLDLSVLFAGLAHPLCYAINLLHNSEVAAYTEDFGQARVKNLMQQIQKVYPHLVLKDNLLTRDKLIDNIYFIDKAVDEDKYHSRPVNKTRYRMPEMTAKSEDKDVAEQKDTAEAKDTVE
ncbi:hypothetical protein [Psittacicella hinzii]|uniref:Uncharacterized protein n=1 Tax=Psittacicella hinzii TaxID=2028575 RepID=A0A3A1YJK4_9GAMM|nr:hypothetical protein [Psittacicella hinzii]RIY38453.1 hypothetical protein CKF58_04330 [Psittacicella hinzii]